MKSNVLKIGKGTIKTVSSILSEVNIDGDKVLYVADPYVD